ncbi:hypothetical protein SAVIM40S_08294 [Streptomyces avidinii]
MVPLPVLSRRHGTPPDGGSSAECERARASRGAVTVPRRTAIRARNFLQRGRERVPGLRPTVQVDEAEAVRVSVCAEVTRPQLVAAADR